MLAIPETIKPYIDAKWWTVPLGKISRDAEGKKQFKFPKGHNFQREFNEIAGQAGTAFCGKQSDITFLDFDNDLLFELACNLAPECTYVAKSDMIGKGGHLGFKYIEALPSRRVGGKLDVLNDGSQVFLVSQGNETKIPLKWSVELVEMPSKLLEFVKFILDTKAPISANTTNVHIKGSLNVGFKLAPMLDQLEDGKFYPPLFRIITPKDFRNIVYEKQGYLHPNDVSVTSRGSEYLSKVAAILASDMTVSEDLFVKTINYINKLWDDPMPQARLNATIINRMISGEATNENGEPFWNYNQHWDLEGVVGTTKQGDTFEVFYEPEEAKFIFVNLTKKDYAVFQDKTKCLTHIQMLTGRKITNDNFMQLIKNIHLVNEPTADYGYYNKGAYEYFNTFSASNYLAVLRDPKLLNGDYQEPETILAYLETFMPNEKKRTFFLKWLKHKLLTFEYSPLIFLFIGVSGSGKNTLFEDIITPFIGSDYVGTPSVQEFTDKFNGWILDKYFFFLDEFGELAKSKSEHEQIKANLKRFTGSGTNGTLSLRLMHRDSFQYNMKGSFIMAANKFPLILDPDDRRLVIIETPNSLVSQKWVQDLGGTNILKRKIQAELIHFAYYLSRIEDIEVQTYTTMDAKDEEKLKFLVKTSPLHILIPYLLETKHFDVLFDFFIEKLPNAKCLDTWDRGYILASDLDSDYESITGKEAMMINNEMKSRGFKKTMFTFQNKTQTGYEVLGLRDFIMPQRSASLIAIKTEEIEVD